MSQEIPNRPDLVQARASPGFAAPPVSRVCALVFNSITLPEFSAVQDAVRQGKHGENPSAMPALAWMSAVLRGGYRLLKGDAEAAKLFALTLSKMPAPRLSDDQVLAVAEGVVCDWVAARRLVSRGELVAARRCLHLQLNESNLALLHELRQRQGRISFLVGERWHWPPLGLRAQ